MYALNALVMFALIAGMFLVTGSIADRWPTRDKVEAWLDGYFTRAIAIWEDAAEDYRDNGCDADPDVLKRGDRAWNWYWRIDRALRLVRIAYPHPSTCESCGRVSDASTMTIHDGQFEVCPTCEHESTRTRTVFWAMRDLRNRL